MNMFNLYDYPRLDTKTVHGGRRSTLKCCTLCDGSSATRALHCVALASCSVSRTLDRSIFAVATEIRDRELRWDRRVSWATPKDLLIDVQWSEVYKHADELITVCKEVIVVDADMTQVKQDFRDLIPFASENVSGVTISSVLPETTGTRDERIEERNNFLKDKCRDTDAQFVDNDQDFLFRDGSCDTSAFQNDGVHFFAIRQDRLVTGSRNSVAACRLVVPRCRGRNTLRPTGRRPPKQGRCAPDSRPADAGGRIAAGHLHISGQFNKCGKTNHVTQTCRHEHDVSCFVCGQKNNSRWYIIGF